MSLLLGDIAPDFDSHTQSGTFNFYEWLDNSWAILFSHPKDFTPVCSTEIAEVAQLLPDFTRRNVKVATLSAGSPESHRDWAKELSVAFDIQVEFPLIADGEELAVARLYGMVHPNTSDVTTIRSVFVIDPNKRVRLTLSYPHTTGRNFHELLRTIDSLQLADRSNIVTPAEWEPGDRVLVPHDVSDEKAGEQFDDIDRPLPYVRRVTPPN